LIVGDGEATIQGREKVGAWLKKGAGGIGKKKNDK